MATSINAQYRTPKSLEIPQDGLGTIILMFAWPAVWFTILIYVIGRQFFPEGGTTPTWLLLTITVFGTGAELVAGLILFRREGYALTLNALRERIRWQWPKGWKAWILAGIVFILGMSLSMAMGPVNHALAGVPGFVPPDWWPAASNPLIPVKSAAADLPPPCTPPRAASAPASWCDSFARNRRKAGDGQRRTNKDRRPSTTVYPYR